MIRRPLLTFLSLLGLCLTALVGCSNPTYVLITVEADPSITEEITELRFDSLLVSSVPGGNSDSQRVDNGGRPMKLPDIYTVLADGWGGNGEVVEMVVEGFNAAGEVVARGRAQATLIAGKESTLRIVLTIPCALADACLTGQAFCDNPQRCNCEGDACLLGVCESIDKDDSNPCTEFFCDEPTQEASATPINDGDACGTSDEGSAQFCGQGLCKVPVCGDFVIDVATEETCDEGSENSDANYDGITPIRCRSNCKLPSCGDGSLDMGEQCDNGDANVTIADGVSGDEILSDACRQEVRLDDGSGAVLNCVLPFCGDGVIDSGERCDDHDVLNGDGCNPTCSLFGEVTILAGQPGGPGNSDGAGSNARINSPANLVASGGFAYFASREDHIIRRVTIADGTVTTIAGQKGKAGDVARVLGGAVVAGRDARFDNPISITVSGTDLYVGDSENKKIKHVDLSNNEFNVTTVAGNGFAGQDDGSPGAAVSEATLAEPRFMAINGNDLLFLDLNTDFGCFLRSLDLATQTVSTLAGRAGASGCVLVSAIPGFMDTQQLFSSLIGGMTMADNGSLYISEATTVRRVTFAPLTITTISGFVGAAGLAATSTEMYVADAPGVIRQFNLATPVVTTLGTDIALAPVRAIAVEGSTLLFSEQAPNDATIRGGDLNNDPINVIPIAGAPATPGSDDATDPLGAFFSRPTALALNRGRSNTLFVVDQSETVVREIDLSADSPVVGATTRTLDSSGAPAFMTIKAITASSSEMLGAFVGGAATTVRDLPFPSSIVQPLPSDLVSSNEVGGIAILDNVAYMTIPFDSKILAMDLATNAILPFSGFDSGADSLIDGSFSTATYLFPKGIVACGGDLYVTESKDANRVLPHVIRKLNMTTQTVTTIAGATTDFNHVDGPGVLSRFDTPEGIACDDRNPNHVILYVGDMGSHTIRQLVVSKTVGPNGLLDVEVTTLAGSPYSSGAVDGIGVNANFNGPQALVFDSPSGDLIVVDRNENVVRRIH